MEFHPLTKKNKKKSLDQYENNQFGKELEVAVGKLVNILKLKRICDLSEVWGESGIDLQQTGLQYKDVCKLLRRI